MIMTECPTCDHPHLFDWEPKDRRHGWFPHVCDSCRSIMWVQKTTIAGITYDSPDFFAKIVQPEDIENVRAAEVAARAEVDEGLFG